MGRSRWLSQRGEQSVVLELPLEEGTGVAKMV